MCDQIIETGRVRKAVWTKTVQSQFHCDHLASIVFTLLFDMQGNAHVFSHAIYGNDNNN